MGERVRILEGNLQAVRGVRVVIGSVRTTGVGVLEVGVRTTKGWGILWGRYMSDACGSTCSIRVRYSGVQGVKGWFSARIGIAIEIALRFNISISITYRVSTRRIDSIMRGS